MFKDSFRSQVAKHAKTNTLAMMSLGCISLFIPHSAKKGKRALSSGAGLISLFCKICQVEQSFFYTLFVMQTSLDVKSHVLLCVCRIFPYKQLSSRGMLFVPQGDAD